jgi:hypothetical protein
MQIALTNMKCGANFTVLGVSPMFWLPALLSGLCFMVVAGRAHSRHLDALEARWRMPVNGAAPLIEQQKGTSRPVRNRPSNALVHWLPGSRLL